VARTPANRTHKTRVPIPEGDFYPFRPRSYQRSILQAFSIDPATKIPRTRHGVWVVHRRGGKDATAFCGITIPAMAMRPGNYFYIFPKFAQAKRAIWQEETSFLDRIPPHWDPKRLETELFVEVRVPPSGKVARIFLLGADDTATVSKLVGTNPLGVVYSEAALIDKSVRGLLSPALAANGGWELFVGTPRGKNWFHDLYRMALTESGWFCELLTVDQTRKDGPGEDGSPVIPQEEISAYRRSGITEEEIQQEYWCSWEGYSVGTIYGDLLRQARAEGRIGQQPYDPRKPVGVTLDLGRSDLTAAWFWQVDASRVVWMDYWAARGETSSSTIRFLKEQRPYHYARVVLPHDAREKRYGALQSVQEEFEAWFPGRVVIADKAGVQLGINAVRRMFSRFYFDEAKCGLDFGPAIPSGLDSLGNYRRKFDDEKKDFSAEPVHDQFSHGADALRGGVMAWQEGLEFAGIETVPLVVETAFRLDIPRLGGLR